jgi:aryl-alcohol dehydrogenase-like predicted oxidoreductase
MQQRTLGRSGLQVSVIGLGCNNFGNRIEKDASRLVVDRAIELGINLFDTADIYGNRGGSETILGELLGNRRKDIILATKFAGQMDDAGFLKGTSRRYIMRAVDASLQRLRTDWIDLYQVHFSDPDLQGRVGAGPAPAWPTPVEETLSALDDLVHAGKVRYIGCSNHAAWMVADAQWTAQDRMLTPFISAQDEYSLVVRGAERELIPAMRRFGMGLLPYFPLASGLLTGKYAKGAGPADARLSKSPQLAERYLTEANLARVEKLRAFCDARGRTLLELAFSWLLARSPVTSVIAGATKPEQLDQNVKAGDWTLTADEIAEVDRITA